MHHWVQIVTDYAWGLVVQPDGDVLLCVPSDFGRLADNHEQARRFMSEANRQLAEIRHGLPVDWSALLFLTFETGGALIAVICGVEGLTGLPRLRCP